MRIFSSASNLRSLGSWLALAAMALQLALAAAHHHGGLFTEQHSAVAAADKKGDGNSSIPLAPADGDDCLLCLGLAVAAIAILPLAVLLGGAGPHDISRPFDSVVAASRRHSGFSPRAPPLSEVT
jgi:hypothetical protein